MAYALFRKPRTVTCAEEQRQIFSHSLQAVIFDNQDD